MMKGSSFVRPEEKIAELTIRSVILAIFLTVLLALSNAYLALKLGILTSASIPAAIISMGILRFFKNPTILENNAVQTAASAGEAVAGGIVYTIPALIIIQYWYEFDYVTNFLIAVCGGILGVLFSIPLRRILVNEPLLRFPEGRAIVEVLKSSDQGSGVSDIFMGGVIGGFLELFQVGFKLIASSVSFWFVAGRSLFGFGAGFSATMIGAGYLVGSEMAVSIFIGAILSWLIAMPIVSQFYPQFLQQQSAHKAAILLWNSEMRYLGIGAMLFAGVWTFIKLIKPLLKSIRVSLRDYRTHVHPSARLRTEHDLSMFSILVSVLSVSVVLFIFFHTIFPLETVGIKGFWGHSFILGSVLYVLIIGFLFSVMTAYFSGMVGVTASPGSSVVIAGMLFAAWIILTLIHQVLGLPLTAEQIKAAEAMTIIVGSIVTGIAAIANDNTQDLKVGHLIGATPWKQQVMLLLGVVVSSLVIPPVMQLLFDVYGIAGIMPHEGMDPALSLPAPTAALMAAITQAVFHHAMPWAMMLVGAAIMMILLIIVRLCPIEKLRRLSILGIAIGMYLPTESTFPLFLGGLIALCVQRRGHKKMLRTDDNERKQKGVLIACGLVAGSALMDVLLAVPFSMLHSPDALSFAPDAWYPYSVFLGVVSIGFLAFWINKRVCC